MWQIIHDNWQFFLVGEYPRGPLGGLAMTVLVALLSLALTFPCAVLVALARTSGVRVLVRATTALVYGVRGMPLLMLIFWVYFALPAIIGVRLTPFITLILAIVVYQTAYLSEVIRAGIEALPKGQTEAARALGMRYVTLVWKVILPQALYNVLPGMLNQLTAIFKETSLGYIIAVNEITYTANLVNLALVTKPLQVFGIVAAIYFVLCFSLTQAARYLEGRVARRRSSGRIHEPLIAGGALA